VTEAYHEALDRVERDHWWFQALRRLATETLQGTVPPPARVLDVGCSTGHLLDALPAAYDRTGLDVSADAVALAQRLRPGITFAAGSIEALPLRDASFDAVLAIDVISAAGVEDDLRAVSELRRVLRPGGTLIAQVAAYEWLRSGHDLGAGTARRYTAQRFERLLREGGFTPVRLTYRVSSVFVLAAVWRLLRRRGSQSDVAPVPRPLNWILAVAMAAEHPIVLRGRLPFGLSVFAIARVDGCAR
jgi:SAM-dependent methyltransferase